MGNLPRPAHAGDSDAAHFAAIARGTTVADPKCMAGEPRKTTVTMRCPLCQSVEVSAAADSSLVIAWFTCPACGHDWSARLRNGTPDVPREFDMTDLAGVALIVDAG